MFVGVVVVVVAVFDLLLRIVMSQSWDLLYLNSRPNNNLLSCCFFFR